MSFFKKKSGPTVSKADRVPFGQKIAYGLGGVVNPFIDFAQGAMLLFFNQGLGINPGLVTTFGALFRGWDSASDPIVGNYSDNLRTKWGRRRPLIVIGAILFGLTIPLHWSASENMSHTMIVVWMVITGLILYTAATIWYIPYQSLGLEMTSDTNERTRLMGFRTFFSFIGGLVATWVPWLAVTALFAGPILASGEPNISQGMYRVGWLLCAFIAIIGIIPGLFCKEKYYDAGLTEKQEKVSLIKSFRQCLTCRPLILLLIMMLTQVIGALLVQSLGGYVIRYYVCGGDIRQSTEVFALVSTVAMPIGLLSVPAWVWICERLGKKTAISLVVVLGIVGKLLIFVFYVPGSPWLMIVPHCFLAFYGAAMWMVVPSMLGDCVDYDELKNGTRREGALSSTFLFFIKVGVTLSSMISGWVLVGIGFDVALVGDQNPGVVEAMRNYFVFIPIVFWIITLVLIGLYPLNTKRTTEIRAELEARRGTI